MAERYSAQSLTPRGHRAGRPVARRGGRGQTRCVYPSNRIEPNRIQFNSEPSRAVQCSAVRRSAMYTVVSGARAGSILTSAAAAAA